MIKIEDLRKKIEEVGYYATDELIYEAFNALIMFESNKKNAGQDIFAVCLEGPPGAGKTEFAKTYTKVSNKLFDNNVEMIDYQCDATTGKTELFEDINISAAIRGDAEHVNIPGKLVEAITKVNEGKKVVLFIDEYDKAREETDAFLLQFLQSGKINSNQHGDLEIKDEYKANLQVILCKNDMREELSGPLSRRIRIIRLDYMKPSVFYKVANRVLIDDRDEAERVNDGLLNLVSLMYQKIYDDKDIYNRLPSCSEMLIAIEDANRLMKYANAPKNIIYTNIIKNMFKAIDDIDTFHSKISNSGSDKDKKLKDLISEMLSPEQTTLEETTINELIAEKVFLDENKKLISKMQEVENLIATYQEKFQNMEEKRKQAIEQEINKILLENGSLVATKEKPIVESNFEDEAVFIKRGQNILDITENDWLEVGDFHIKNLSHAFLIDYIIEYASKLNVTLYENGILIKEDEDEKLIVVKETDPTGKKVYKILSSNPIIPSTYINDIKNFINFAIQVQQEQPKTGDMNVNQALEGLGEYKINALIYNDTFLDYKQVRQNAYHLEIGSKLDNSLIEFNQIVPNLVCFDVKQASIASKEIMKQKKLVKTNE